MNWYGVLTFYRWDVAEAEVKNPTDKALLETRVVIVRATDDAEAVEKAKKEAADYCRDGFVNLLGERITIKHLGVWSRHEFFEEPSDLVEVFSTTEIADRSKPVESLAIEKLGLGAGPGGHTGYFEVHRVGTE